MTTEDLLRAGIEAARAGDMERAASFFAQVVKADPASDKGWYLLGMTVKEPERRAFCLRRALALNPNNDAARKQLDQVLSALPPSPAPVQPSASAVDKPGTQAAAPSAPAPGAGAPVRPADKPAQLSTPVPAPKPAAASESGGWKPPQWPPPMPRYEPREDEGEIAAETAATDQTEARPFWAESDQSQDQNAFGGADNLERLSPYASSAAEAGSIAEPAEQPADAVEPEPARPAWLEGPEPSEPDLSVSKPESRGPQYEYSGMFPPPVGSKAEPAAAPTPKPAPPAVSPVKGPARPLEQHASEVRKTLDKAKKRKQSNRIIVVAIVILMLMLCALGIGYLVLSGRLSAVTPGAFLQLPAGSLQMPTALLIPTATATEIAAPTATQVPATPTATALPTPKPIVSYTPTFESAACQFTVPKGAHVTCGYLVVPEDRTGDPAHTIRLAVAVYHSTSSNPAAEPVLFLQGGPGGEAVKLSADAYSILVEPFLKDRDFIAYDQRGTGISEPALDCPDLTKAYLQDIYGQIAPDSRKIVYANAFLSCQGQTSVGGVNLNAYTTEESAADVKDLMQVLKYQQVDLYGASYGTRLAQVILRDDPGLVHAAILDSVVPIETNFFAEYPSSIEEALRLLFDSCKADAACNAAYPDLETVFWDQVKRLDASPVPLTVANPKTGTVKENVDGAVFINVVLMSLKTSSLIETAPQTIYRFKAGDYSTVIAAEYSLPYAFEGINIGLYISMMCHEQILRTTPDELQAAMSSSADVQTYAWLPFFGNAQDVYRYCQSWRAAGPYLGENDPVSSDVPTLVIAGKFDPTTPPKYAQLVASHLSHSYYFEFPNQGHTPTAADSSGCAMGIAVSFLRDPQVEPDRSCLSSIEAISFVLPYTGNPPVGLSRVDVGGVSARMPSDWQSLGDGFSMRANSPFDITQIGMIKVPGTTSADLLNWLSQKAWGYRGLDTAPVWASQRKANGLQWTMYTSTSYGRPVDIAMADHNGSSIVVLAFSNIDEHDALYQTVFLPVVDSIQP